MKDTKTVHIAFAFYDRANLEKFLEEQAAEGWMLRGREGGALEFYRIQPSKIHFSIVYYHSPVTKTALTANQAEYLEYCARTGWYLVDTERRMMILANQTENPIPIETDPKIQLDNIHKSLKKQNLSWMIVFFVSGILHLLLFCLHLSLGIVHMSTSISGIQFIMIGASYCATSLPDIIGYYRWRRKAQIAAQEGMFYETRINNTLHYIFLFFAYLATIATLTFSVDPTLIGVVIAVIVVSLGLTLWYVVRRIFRKTHPAIFRQVIQTSLALFEILALLVVLLNSFFPVMYSTDGAPAQPSDMPLSITELTDSDFSDYTNDKYSQGTILLTQDEYRQEALGYGSDLPELYYTITYVHADFLYDACQKDLLKDFARHGEAITVDASGWNAEAAYQLYEHGSAQHEYLLCYDGHIVEIRFGWEPTAEQMAIVGQKLAGK